MDTGISTGIENPEPGQDPPPNDAPGTTDATVAPAPTAAAKQQEGPVQLPIGTILGAQWMLIKKLGEGGCGAVYLVESTKDKRRAALKAENNFVEGGSVLKIEVDILTKLRGKKHVCEMLHCGRLNNFQYVVMSLLGECLGDLIRACNNILSISTMLRIGVHVLHGLKQIHDAGFVHRDIKPANLALGRKEGHTDPNFIYVLDFGLSRSFVKMEGGKLTMRKPRKTALFRGTTRYCSASANLKHDQSRVDDLWSLVYVLVEMRGKLPWAEQTEHAELADSKLKTDDRKLFSECPSQLCEFARHLRTLDYFKKPNYHKLYGFLTEAMNEAGVKFSDPWDWQLLKKNNALEQAKAEWKVLQGKRKATSKKSTKLKTRLKSFKKGKAEPKSDPPPPPVFEEMVLPDPHPFTEEDFKSEPLGL